MTDYTPTYLEQVTHDLDKAQKAYDEALITYNTLADNDEDLLASLMNEISIYALEKGEEFTEQKLKRLARVHTKWVAFKIGLKEAKDKKLRLSSELKHARNLYKTCERNMSYKRDEMRLGGFSK